MAPMTHSEAARIAFDVVLCTWVLLESWIRLRSHLTRGGSRRDRGSLFVVVASVGAGLGGAVVLAGNVHPAAIADGRRLFFVAGLVLMTVGIAIRLWAVAVLGRFFTIDVRVHPGQTVVERGPYRWVRHPAYAGLIVTFVGIGLALGNWLALAVAAVVPTAGLVLR